MGSGGPIFVDIDATNQHQYVQVGVVSWGIGCARADYFGVYARVPNYIDWIENNGGGQTGVFVKDIANAEKSGADLSGGPIKGEAAPVIKDGENGEGVQEFHHQIMCSTSTEYEGKWCRNRIELEGVSGDFNECAEAVVFHPECGLMQLDEGKDVCKCAPLSGCHMARGNSQLYDCSVTFEEGVGKTSVKLLGQDGKNNHILFGSLFVIGMGLAYVMHKRGSKLDASYHSLVEGTTEV